jgi:hypothetical protein
MMQKRKPIIELEETYIFKECEYYLVFYRVLLYFYYLFTAVIFNFIIEINLFFIMVVF